MVKAFDTCILAWSRLWFIAFGLALASVAGCGRAELTPESVLAFIDEADNAARKRFGPDICQLRGRDFVTHEVMYAAGERYPERATTNRKAYCMAVAGIPRFTIYILERSSIDIVIAPDRQTAVVTAQYVERMPYYDPKITQKTIDDYDDVEVIESLDTSTVGIEDGDIVFLETSVTARQTLHPRTEMPLTALSGSSPASE